ncbi:extracellular triacylglycerol lipase precursor [Pholiota conissans]|uniref:Carboxylic ester hydrolase n=1 Tax=Pholiota conissans TaxID=109636 RepID=A0A9P5YL97_9AGAR|nr:extracellular triacylglycerol lipase precursor [Pholiota conissans]
MLITLLISTTLFSVALGAPQVRIGKTTLTGIESSDGIEFFGGIPFAKPPLGSLRLQPPVLTTSLEGSIFNATAFGPSCLQTDLPPNQVSEDCLQLNVFRPSNAASKKKLPIMFWIFGGGFTIGGPSFYNGSDIVAKSVSRGTPVIFVSVNYRLGPLGFPQGAEAGDKKILNLGLKDILAGLKWVQANIEAFGGDKKKVTLIGESAGATSAFELALGTHIKGLARAVIAESVAFLPAFGPKRGEAAWQAFVSAVPGCTSVANTSNTLDCLQSVNSRSILQALQVTVPATSGLSDVSWFPNIDGHGGLIPDALSKLTSTMRLPIIIGNNRDEGTLFAPQDTNSTTQTRNIVINFSVPSLQKPPSKKLNDTTNKLLELYPEDNPAFGSPFGTGNQMFGLNPEFKRWAAVFGDFVFQAARRKISKSMSASGIKVFGYQFTGPNATAMADIPAAPGSLGVTHSSELTYVFGPQTFGSPASPSLSAIMQDYWISFAVSLNPNDGKGFKRHHWVQYSSNNPIIMQFRENDTVLVPDDYRHNQLQFISEHADVFGI